MVRICYCWVFWAGLASNPGLFAQVEKAEQEKQTAIVRAQGEVSTWNGQSAAWRNLALVHPAHLAEGYFTGA